MSRLRLGKVRLSTIVLSLVFVVAFVSYLLVRPGPADDAGAPPPRVPAVEREDDRPAPHPTTSRPTPRDTGSPTSTPRATTPRDPGSPTPTPRPTEATPAPPSESPSTPPSTSPPDQAPGPSAAPTG
jgi:hypothetical protein